jgi:hypothetical protein
VYKSDQRFYFPDQIEGFWAAVAEGPPRLAPSRQMGALGEAVGHEIDRCNGNLVE